MFNMKVILTLLLFSTLVIDFVSASYDYEMSENTCESSFSCEQVDLHNSNIPEHKENHGDKHCHCHAGHSHIVVLSFAKIKKTNESAINKVNFPILDTKNTQNYISEVIRPPIS